MTFGEKLKTLREAECLTQAELAERCELTPQRVFKIEQGYVADPLWSTVVKLAAGLGVSVAAFADEEPADEEEESEPAPAPPSRGHKGTKRSKGRK